MSLPAEHLAELRRQAERNIDLFPGTSGWENDVLDLLDHIAALEGTNAELLAALEFAIGELEDFGHPPTEAMRQAIAKARGQAFPQWGGDYYPPTPPPYRGPRPQA